MGADGFVFFLKYFQVLQIYYQHREVYFIKTIFYTTLTVEKFIPEIIIRKCLDL